MARSRELRFVLVGDDRSLHRALDRTDRRLDRFGRTAQTAGRLAGRALEGAAVGAGVAAVASGKLAIDFEKNMRNVNSIAQLPEKSLKDLSRQVLELAGPTAQAPETLSQALYTLVSSGFDARESMTILKSSAKGATAGLTDTATSTQAVAAVLNAYRLPASSAAKVTDQLFRTVDRGVISFEDLASNIGDTLPFASQLGVGLDELGASIATMTKQGLSPAETMTRIRNILVSMLKPSDDLSAAYQQLGVDSGEQLIKQEGFQGALEATIKTTDGSKKALAGLFPNIRSLGGALALTGKNSRDAAKDLEGMQKAGGATERALSQQSQSVAYGWQKLKAEGSALGITIGSALLPPLGDAASALGDFVSEARRGEGVGGRVFKGIESEADKIRKRIRELKGEGKSTSEAILEAFTEAAGRAAVELVEQTAKAAPKAAHAFFDAFRASPVWAKLLVAGWLYRRLGGTAAFAALGARASAAMAGGMAGGGAATGAGAGVAAGAAAGYGAAGVGAAGGAAARARDYRRYGTYGRMTYGDEFRYGGPQSQLGPRGGPGIGSRVGGAAKGIGGLLAALGIADAATSTDLGGLGDRVQRGLSSATLGLVPDAKPLQQRFQTAIDQALKGVKPEVDWQNFWGAGSLKDSQKEVVAQVEDLQKQASEILGHPIKLRAEVAANPEQAKRDLNQIRTAFLRLEGGAATSLKDVERTTRGSFQAIARTMGLRSKDGAAAARRNFDAGADAIERMMRRGEVSTRRGMNSIERLMRTHSKGGRDQVEKNFLSVQGVIARTMSKGGKLTDAGMAEIERLTRVTLEWMGLSPDAIRMSLNLKKSARTGWTTPEAQGGVVTFGRAGDSGRDEIYASMGEQRIKVGSGELGVVLTRHQQADWHGMAQQAGYRDLRDYFGKRDRPHYMARGGAAARDRRPFARGGGVAGMVGAANKLDAAGFPYKWGGGHQGSPAPFGPMDCSGAVSYVLQRGGVKIPTMVSGALASAGRPGPGLVTVFANPTHTFMRIGGRYFGTSGTNPGGGAGWFDDPGAGYKARFTQRHFVAGGGLTIPRLRVAGDPGAVRTTVQGSLDMGRRGGNEVLERILSTPLGAGDEGDPGPGAGGDGRGGKRRRRGGARARGGQVGGDGVSIASYYPRQAFARGGMVRAYKALRAAGFRGRALTVALAVGAAESRNYEDMTGDENLGGSYGPWMIHHPSHPEYSTGRLQNDWTYAARGAYKISGGGKDWSPWTTYRNGAYEQWLDEAETVARSAGRVSADGGTDGPRRITEDDPRGRWNWATMGDRDRGVVLKGGGRRVVDPYEFDRLRRAGRIDWRRTERNKNTRRGDRSARRMGRNERGAQRRQAARGWGGRAFTAAGVGPWQTAFESQMSDDEALAALTPGTEDDIRVAQQTIKGWEGFLASAVKSGDKPGAAAAARGLVQARGRLEELTQNTDKLNNVAQALADLVEAVKSLDETEKDRAAYERSFDKVSKTELLRSFVDLMSGELGGRIGQRRLTAGDGVTVARS